MAKVNNKKFRLDFIANKLESIAERKSDGSVSFRGFLLDDLRSLLETSISLSSKVPHSEYRNILWSAIVHTAKLGVFTDAKLLASIKLKERNFLKKKQSDYVLLSSVSISPILHQNLRRRLGQCSFTFSRRVPSHFDTETLSKGIGEVQPHKVPNDYSIVRIRLKSRSNNQAYDIAMKRFDQLRGIWNFSINRNLWSKLGAENRPINQTLTGPMHTLHTPKGTLARKTGFWYEPHFNPKLKALWQKNIFDQALKDESDVRALMRTSSYPNDLSLIFERYSQALDSADHKTSFIGLWSLLEYLTATENDSYDKTIRRCVFRFPDEEFYKQVLEHLRNQRNASVHASAQSDDQFKYTLQLNRYVCNLIVFHLSSKPGFRSRSEACELLDLPLAPKELQRKIRLYRRALKYRSGN